MRNLDMAALRTFVAVGETGSMAAAAQVVARSQPAVSLQMKKLESVLGVELLRKHGRGVELSEAGLKLMVHARSTLQSNDETLAALAGAPAENAIRLGLAQDFAGDLLVQILSKFHAIWPHIGIEIIAERNSDLELRLARNQVDMLLRFGRPSSEFSVLLGNVPMVWVGRHDMLQHPGDCIPMVALEAPCIFRKIGLEALQQRKLRWRIASTSRNLAGQRAAVMAGLGIMVRTPVGLERPLQILSSGTLLPPLPKIGVTLDIRLELAAPPLRDLADIVRLVLAASLRHPRRAAEKADV